MATGNPTGGQSLADLFVEFSIKGLDVVSKGLAEVQKSLEKVGHVGTVAFASLSAAILKTVAEASPRTFDTFTQSLQLLSASIGQAFIPVVAQASQAIQDLAEWFQNLSQDQLDQIAHWAEVALGVAGVAMVLPKITAGLGLATTAVKGLTLAFTTLNMSTGGMLVALGAVAGIFLQLSKASSAGGGGASGFLGIIGQVLDKLRPVGEVLGRLFEALSPLLEKFGGLLLKIADLIIPVLTKMIEALAWVVEKINDLIESFSKPLVKAKAGETAEDVEKRMLEGMGPLANNPLARELARNQGVEAVRDRDAGNKLPDWVMKIITDAAARFAEAAGDKPKARKPLLLARPRVTATIGGIAEAWKRIQLTSLNTGDLERRKLQLQEQGDKRLQDMQNRLAAIEDNTRENLL